MIVQGSGEDAHRRGREALVLRARQAVRPLRRLREAAPFHHEVARAWVVQRQDGKGEAQGVGAGAGAGLEPTRG